MTDKTLKSIREGLGHMALAWNETFWLDTKIPDLNRVIGHREKGIPYGRIIEMSGQPSHGKTAIALSLAALAQHDKALVIWGDFENSFEADWAKTRGVDTENNLVLIQPYVGCFKEKAIVNGRKTEKMSEPRLSTGQELCAEMEQAATAYHKKYDRMLIVVDSIASILTEGEAEAGLQGQNMRTNMELPMFMGKLLRRWVGLAQVYNAVIILTNQLRLNPMQKYGSPWYTPGGNAPLFYSHVRVRVGRVKGGKIMQKGKIIGIQGIMKALKNKAGGSESAVCGYKIFSDSRPIQFVPEKLIKRESGAEE